MLLLYMWTFHVLLESLPNIATSVNCEEWTTKPWEEVCSSKKSYFFCCHQELRALAAFIAEVSWFRHNMVEFVGRNIINIFDEFWN